MAEDYKDALLHWPLSLVRERFGPDCEGAQTVARTRFGILK